MRTISCSISSLIRGLPGPWRDFEPRWSWLLEGHRRSMAENARAALLGAQDGERARQAADEPAAEGQARLAGDLDGRDEGGGLCRVRHLHRGLRAEIREGHRLPGERSRRAARLLRFPRRALEASADDEPDREHFRHRAPPHHSLEGLPLEQDRSRLVEQAQRHWRRLDGHALLPKIILV